MQFNPFTLAYYMYSCFILESQIFNTVLDVCCSFEFLKDINSFSSANLAHFKKSTDKMKF